MTCLKGCVPTTSTRRCFPVFWLPSDPLPTPSLVSRQSLGVPEANTMLQSSTHVRRKQGLPAKNECSQGSHLVLTSFTAAVHVQPMPWMWPGVSCLRSLSPVEGAPNSTSSPYTLFLCVSLHFCPLDKWLLLSGWQPSNDWALQTFSSRVPLILIRYHDPNLCNICQCFKWWFYSLTSS